MTKKLTKTELAINFINENNTKEYVNNYDIINAMNSVGVKGGIVFNKIKAHFGNKVQNPKKDKEDVIKSILSQYVFQDVDLSLLHETYNFQNTELFWAVHKKIKYLNEVYYTPFDKTFNSSGQYIQTYEEFAEEKDNHHESQMVLESQIKQLTSKRKTLAKVLIESGVDLGKFKEFISNIAK